MALQLPTLYQYYDTANITAGLSNNGPQFTLNNKDISIYSGAFHYFRVPRPYWRDRLRKMRAAGLNTVETYIPWNLHEPEPGVYDFGKGGSDWEDFLHIEEFLNTAKEEDLFVLVRPGPYICAEWEFGGFPSWMLPKVKSVRTSKDKNYISLVKSYFNTLLSLLAFFQFQKGGPIIGFQVENEYASTGMKDQNYLRLLKDLFVKNGIKELLYTADTSRLLERGSIPGVLQTANIGGKPVDIFIDLTILKIMHPEKPLMTMESYTGWFDHWTDHHQTKNVTEFEKVLTAILEYPSSINMYMFVGGTNFGFLNGANTNTKGLNNSGLQPTTTSYDYDSPISEFGNLTDKYFSIKNIIAEYTLIETKIPEVPNVTLPVKYQDLEYQGQIALFDLIEKASQKIKSKDVIPMEKLPINNNAGQSYGYITYRKSNLSISANSTLRINGYVRDTVMVLINGKLVSKVPTNDTDICEFGFWTVGNSTLNLPEENFESATLDLIVENMGRVNYGKINNFHQFKGLTEDVFINKEKLVNWEIIPFEFKKSWNRNLSSWNKQTTSAPALYKFQLDITDAPQDTFIDMSHWVKGITIVNGFVLGRHFFVGPEQSLYLPAPLLIKGKNDIIVFEHYDSPRTLKFSDSPIFETPFNFTTACEPPNKNKGVRNELFSGLSWCILILLKYYV